MKPSLPGEVRGGQLHWDGGNPKLFGFIKIKSHHWVLLKQVGFLHKESELYW